LVGANDGEVVGCRGDRDGDAEGDAEGFVEGAGSSTTASHTTTTLAPGVASVRGEKYKLPWLE